jgi:hypothetical protein
MSDGGMTLYELWLGLAAPADDRCRVALRLTERRPYPPAVRWQDGRVRYGEQAPLVLAEAEVEVPYADLAALALPVAPGIDTGVDPAARDATWRALAAAATPAEVAARARRAGELLFQGQARALYERWLAALPGEDQAAATPEAAGRLVVETTVPELERIPWEWLPAGEGQPRRSGGGPRWCGAAGLGRRTLGPLRCAPQRHGLRPDPRRRGRRLGRGPL